MNISIKIFVFLVSLAAFVNLMVTRASADVVCTPIYGGGVVCPQPTPTPMPTVVPTAVPPAPILPKAGVESFILPSLLSLLGTGIAAVGYTKRNLDS